MRIVQLIPSLDVGGAERVAAMLACEQAKLGHDVAVVSLFDPVGSWIEADLRAAGVTLRFLGKRPGLDLRVIPRLARTLRELRPDVLHTHLHVLKYALPARLAGPRSVVVHTVHNVAEREVEPQSQWIQRLAFRGPVTAVAIGEAVATSMARLYGRRPAWVIPNGIPTAAMRSPAGTRARARAAMGVADDTPVILAIGRLNPQKNHAALLAAMADPGLAGAELWIAGEGELRGALTAQAQGGGVAGRVRLLGNRADVSDLLAAADVFALPSRWEGNPLVVMEAMAAGLPVVATAVGCVGELVTVDTGLLVSPEDPAALTVALVALVSNTGLRGSLGIAASLRATACFDLGVMAGRYLRAYSAHSKGGSRSDLGV